MIKILHTIDTTGPGGAETVFVNLIKSLDPDKFSSLAVIHGKGWIYDTLLDLGIKPIIVQSNGSFNYRYLLKLIKIIKKYRINIIQSHLLGSSVYCSLAGLICRIPVIATFHGFVDGSEKDRYINMKKQIINLGAKQIVFVSEHLKKHFIGIYGFSKKKSMTIYNGVDTSKFYPKRDSSIREQLGISPDNILIGAVGNIRPAKGYDYLIKAASLVVSKYPECRFVIVGHGEGPLYESLLNLRRRLGLEECVFLTGFHEDTPTVFNNLDIFVLPSTTEGFSISTIEALACGLPVVVTKSGGPEEIIKKIKNGLWVEPQNEVALANSVTSLISFCKTPEDNSIDREITHHNFSIQKSITEYSNLYLKFA